MTDVSKQAPGIRKHVRPHLLQLPGYEPVEPVDVMARRLGLREEDIVKLDGNENPYGPSPRVAEALAFFPAYHMYPDPAQHAVRAAVGRYAGADAEQVVLGSGSDELLALCAQLFLGPGDAMLNAPPTFGMYQFLGHVAGARVIDVPRREDFTLDLPALEKALDAGAKLLYLASPNNPTGNALPRQQLERLLEHEAVIVVDEAYAEFAGESAMDMVDRRSNLIVVRTFSKWAGLAGLRAGYAVVPRDLVEVLWTVKIPYNVSVAAEQAILASLEDAGSLLANVRLICAERDRMSEMLKELPWLRPYPSSANFLLCEVRGIAARRVRDELRRRGILVRYFDVDGIRNCIRITAGKPEHTDRVLQALKEIGAAVGR